MTNTIGLNFIKSLIKNSLALLSIKILAHISSFIIVVFIAKQLGSFILGEYIVAYNFYIIFYFLPLLGLGNFITREIAKDKTKASRYLVNIGFIGSVTSVFCFILICLIVNLMNYPVDLKIATYLISLALFPTVGILLCEAAFIAFEKVEYLLFAVAVEVTSQVFLSLLVLSLGYGINVIMIVTVISKILGLATCLFFLLRYIIRPGLKVDFIFCKKIIKEFTPIFVLSSILGTILLRIDVVILSKVRQIIEVGWYGCASKFVWIGYIFIFSVTANIFPIISKLFITSRDLFETICRKFLKYISIILFLMVIVTVLFSDKLILLFFGREFINSAVALRILIWLLFPLGWATFCGYILIAGDNQRMDLYALGIAFGSDLVLNLFLSYKWGYLGTSIATLISMSVLAASEYFFVYKYMFKLNIFSIVWKLIISAVIMGAFMLLFREQTNPFILIISSLVIYFLSLFILRTFPKEDIDLFRRLWKSMTASKSGT